MATRQRFPFSAVVGQEEAKLALILNAIDPAIGGVLLRGEKGSAKSTLARGLAGLLPGNAPFVELPLGATEDRVVGSFDLAAAMSAGEHRFRPGLLAEAHGGVLYIDEVNLLPDHLVDVLLDVAASGLNRVEREGISREHESRFVLVGSMNPEEGELRPQLLDRFGLCVDVEAARMPSKRAETVRRRLSFDADPDSFVSRFQASEAALAARLARAVGASEKVAAMLPDGLVEAVGRLCVEMGAEGMRADMVICRSAAALARWEERSVTAWNDVERVAAMALSHRSRRSPLDAHGQDREALEEALRRVKEGSTTSINGHDRGGQPKEGAVGKCRGAEEELFGSRGPDGAVGSDPGQGTGFGPGEGEPGDHRGDGSRRSEDEPLPPMRVGLGESVAKGRVGIRVAREGASGRARTRLVESSQGRSIGSRAFSGEGGSIALAATVSSVAQRTAARAHTSGKAEAGQSPLLIEPVDLREHVRVSRQSRLVVFALDASGSMGVEERISATRSALAGLLLDAYRSRDRVAVVAFRGDSAELVVAPTGSVEVAGHRMEAIATGGATPLAEGIRRAMAVSEKAAANGLTPLLVLVSDGRATYSDHGDPWDEALQAARAVAERGLEALVVDAERGPVRLGLARRIASEMGAPLICLDELGSI